MNDIYFWTALVGCSLLVIQVILQVIGLGGEHDMDTRVHLDTDFDSWMTWT